MVDVCDKLRRWLFVSIGMQEDQVGIEDDGVEAMHEEHSSREPEGPIPLVGSHPLARPFLFKPPVLTVAASGFVYSRPTDTSVYVNPTMALNMNTSMTSAPINSHLPSNSS